MCSSDIDLYIFIVAEEDYEGNVKVKTLNMNDADKLLKEKDKYPIWLKD